MNSKEKKLLEGFIAAHKACREQFVKEYTDLIYSAIYRTFARWGYEIIKENVEDLYQDVFLSLLENDCAKLISFKGDCSLSTWLFIITKHTVINFINKESKYRDETISLHEKIGENEESELADIIQDDTQGNGKSIIEEKIDKEEMIDFVYKYLKKFDLEEQYILKAFYFQKIPLKQIAKVLGKSEDAAFEQKNRLLKELEVMHKKEVGS